MVRKTKADSIADPKPDPKTVDAFTGMTLSEAAKMLRSNTSTPEEKRKAAAVIGYQGGKNSHKNDGKSNAERDKS